jgi:hypothetical protein
MGGEGMMSHMNQSLKDNKSLVKGRKKMADNPYFSKDISLENRNPSNYNELIEHRFWRKAFSRKITFLYYLILGVFITSAIVYFIFFI